MVLKRSILPPPKLPIRPDVSLFIVNIVLLLILFFLATGTLVNTPDQGVQLSETRDLPIGQIPSPVLVVGPEGALTLDTLPITSEALVNALGGETLLHVLMDKTAPAHDLLNLVSQPGLATLKIRLVTINRQDRQ